MCHQHFNLLKNIKTKKPPFDIITCVRKDSIEIKLRHRLDEDNLMSTVSSDSIKDI